MLQNSLLHFVGLPVRIVNHFRQKGVLDTWNRIRFLTRAAWWERRLGIETRGYIPWNCLGDNPESVDYEPVGYVTLKKIFKNLTIRQSDVFVDYGCGKGRPLFFATQYPFRRLIGIDMSQPLVEAAEVNRETLRAKQRRQHVEILQADAKTWKVPADVTFVFLFNPFVGQILQGAIDQLFRSWSQQPRQMTIVYVQPVRDPSHFDNCDWLVATDQVESEGLKYSIYRSRPSERATIPTED
jgi:SAM-dependent methyltransferase